MLEEWAYIRDWHSETERHLAYDGFVHFYVTTVPTVRSAEPPLRPHSTAYSGTTSPSGKPSHDSIRLGAKQR